MVQISVYQAHDPCQTATYIGLEAFLYEDFLMLLRGSDMGGVYDLIHISDRVSEEETLRIVRDAVNATNETVDDFTRQVCEMCKASDKSVTMYEGANGKDGPPPRPRQVVMYHRSREFGKTVFERIIRHNYGFADDEQFHYVVPAEQPAELFVRHFYRGIEPFGLSAGG
jgi:hypothetical protein